MSGRAFGDSNVLVYAHDRGAGVETRCSEDLSHGQA